LSMIVIDYSKLIFTNAAHNNISIEETFKSPI
jgi:hypothetical protein